MEFTNETEFIDAWNNLIWEEKNIEFMKTVMGVENITRTKSCYVGCNPYSANNSSALSHKLIMPADTDVEQILEYINLFPVFIEDMGIDSPKVGIFMDPDLNISVSITQALPNKEVNYSITTEDSEVIEALMCCAVLYASTIKQEVGT